MKRYPKHILKPFFVFITSLFVWLTNHPVQAQESYRWLVQSIDSSNTALLAYQKRNEAQKMQNRTGLTPSNPEVDVNYLRSNPRLPGHRLDYSISQSFDFPSVYSYKKKVATEQNALVDQDYRIFRANLINRAINTYLQWVYYNQLGTVLKKQKEYAEDIASSYQKKFENGAINILERNKARLNAVSAQKEFEINDIALRNTYQELIRYNQGRPFPHLSPEFPPIQALVTGPEYNEATLLDHNNELQSLDQEVELSETQLKLVNAQTLPQFNIGYMREQDIELEFRGLTFGMTIPLWQHKNTKKQARLNSQALKQVREDARSQYALEVRAAQERLNGLYRIMQDLESIISQTRGLELLNRAFDLQEITILEYLMEQSMYSELTQKFLETRMNYHVTLAELHKWAY